jgi:putative membrane-bound dehydrogenase-like protein
MQNSLQAILLEIFRKQTCGALVLVCASLALAPPVWAAAPVPRVHDRELELSLFASEPDIATPIGIAVDQRNRVFVVESNTHETKPDYAGHKHDRIKIFEDADDDGTADKVAVFADGLRHAMNLAFGPNDQLYMTHRAGVVRFESTDTGALPVKPVTLVELETAERYPHNGIGGIAFSPDGWLYFGLGENLGRAYTVKGSDDSRHSGGGEGGNIFRCRPDGTQVRLIATGFWNPFALEFDRAGHFFAVDNDPDGRPPSRLLHVMEHGDYGYKFRYGRSGNHPFVAWEGELPGTLPMISGTAEAPSGILDSARALLPGRYSEDLLVTGWGDNVVERFTLRREGASFKADRHVLIEGDKSFWPVGIAPGPNGTIYITDWADSAYPVHGKGRIWRLRTATGAATHRDSIVKQRSAADQRLERLLASRLPSEREALFSGLRDPDPFIRSAATAALAAPVWRADVLRGLEHEDPEARLGSLLALRRGNYSPPASLLKRLLADSDISVRRMALVWAGENARTEVAQELGIALDAGAVTVDLFKAYLAAADLMEAARAGRSDDDKSVWAQGATGGQLMHRVLRDKSKPVSLRALAAAMLSKPDLERILPDLLQFARSGETPLRLEVIRTLGQSDSPEAGDLLWDIARNQSDNPSIRAEAVLAQSAQRFEALTVLTNLLDDAAAAVRVEAARTLRLVAGQDDRVTDSLRRTYKLVKDSPGEENLAEQLEFALFGPGRAGGTQRPESEEGWIEAAAKGGDPENGRRVFFHATSACASCHKVNGRGGVTGPDLSVIGRSSNRAKLVQSIVSPSVDIAPQYVSYDVEMLDGEIYSGLLHGRGSDGSITLLLASGGTMTLPGDQIGSSNASSISLMPAGLENALTLHDFRDLIAFLESLR